MKMMKVVSQKDFDAQVQMLNVSARRHEAAGDDVLAKWMRESSEYFAERSKKVDRMFAKKAEPKKQLVMGSFEEYAHDWYAWQEAQMADGFEWSR